MKRFALIAAAGLIVGLAACNNNKSSDAKAATPAKASPGAVNENKSGCCKDKANTSAGAVGEKKDCSKDCSKSCDKAGTSAGAVSEKKSDCSKSSCDKSNTSAGAVSGKKSDCASACPFAGKSGN